MSAPAPGFGVVQVVSEFSNAGGVETVAWELQRHWAAQGVPSRVLAATAPCGCAGVRLALPRRLARAVPTRGRWRYLGRPLLIPAFTMAASAKLWRGTRPGAWADGAVVLSHGDSLLADVVVIHAVNAASLRQKRRDGEWRWALNPMHLWVEGRDRLVLRGGRVRRFVAVSRRVVTELWEHHRVGPERIAVIPNGIDLERFCPEGPTAGLRAAFGIGAETKLLLFVGHEFDRKGLGHAISALREPGCEAMHLVAVGAGDEAAYRRLARDHGVGERVHFAGPRQDMPAIYREADAFVFPSAYETFSLVCMEAMACGVPVFAARAGGIEDYLRDGTNGFTVERDGRSVAASLVSALADPALSARLREGARRTTTGFGWPAIAAQYQELLFDVWREKRSEAPTNSVTGVSQGKSLHFTRQSRFSAQNCTDGSEIADMPNSMPFAGPLLDDDQIPLTDGPIPQPPPGPRPVTSRPTAVPPSGPLAQPRAAVPRLAAPTAPSVPPLRPAQRACYDALGLAMREGYVFAALTGPAGSGKSTVLEAVITDLRDRSLRWIRITEPDKVPARLAAQIEQIAYAEAGKPENGQRHVVIAVDDAHTGSDELLRCLTRISTMREPGRRVPQMLLVGRPELWTRLTIEEFEPLARRLVVRATLPAVDNEDDPWASVEQELTHTMTHLRGDTDRAPAPPASMPIPEPEPMPAPQPVPDTVSGPVPMPQGPVFDRVRSRAPAVPPPPPLPPLPPLDEDEVIPPPSMYALFPDAPPVAATKPREREGRSRLLLPLGCLFVTVAAVAFVLSFYDWPDLMGDLPWADTKPAAPIAIPQSPRAQASGLPAPPSWVGQSPSSAPTHHVDAAPPPPAAKPVEHPPVIAAAPPPPAPMHTAEASAPPLPPPAPPQSNSPPTPAPQAPPPSPPAPAPAAPPPPAPAPAASAPAAPTPAPIRTADARDVRPAPAAATMSPALVALMLRRGDEEFAIGDVSAARLLYQRAAEAGSALGARLEARTYDEAFLPPADANTLSDLQAARTWYARSAALGDKEAAERLKAIGGGK